MAGTYVNEGRLDQLNRLLTDFGTNIKVGLFTNVPATGETTILSGITLATFPGYAPQTFTYGTVVIDGNGNALAPGATKTFTHSATAGSETIKGWCIYDAVAGKLHFFTMLPAAVVLAADGDKIDVTPNWYHGLLPPPL